MLDANQSRVRAILWGLSLFGAISVCWSLLNIVVRSLGATSGWWPIYTPLIWSFSGGLIWTKLLKDDDRQGIVMLTAVTCLVFRQLSFTTTGPFDLFLVLIRCGEIVAVLLGWLVASFVQLRPRPSPDA